MIRRQGGLSLNTTIMIPIAPSEKQAHAIAAESFSLLPLASHGGMHLSALDFLGGLIVAGPCNQQDLLITMRADMFAYMIHLEGPEYPEYAMHLFYLKSSGTPTCGNMLGNSLPVGPVPKKTENYLKNSGMLCTFFYIKHSQEEVYFR